MDISDILLRLTNQYKETHGSLPTKTKLLKLAYMVELKYFRRFRTRLTSEKWVYYLYGPYIRTYDAVLNSNMFDMRKGESGDSNFVLVSPMGDNKDRLEYDVRQLVVNVVSDYGSMELNDLLDLVYFNTEPMMAAEKRGELLEFSSANSEEYYSKKDLKIDPKVKKDILSKLRKSAASLHGQ